MDSILLLHYLKTEFGFFKLESQNHSFFAVFRMIKISQSEWATLLTPLNIDQLH